MPTVGIDEERQPIRELHEYIFMPLIGILGLLLQVKHAAESASLFVTEHVTMLTFIVVFIVYFGLLTVKLFSRPTRNSNMAKFMTNITLLSGSLASILLLKILVPAYGWLALFFWMIYLIRDVVTKKSYWRALVHVFRKVRVLICGSSAAESNVDVQPPPVPEVVVPIQDARQRTMAEPNEPRPTPLPDAVSQPAGLPV
ncbi:hypothetical protein ACLB2K_073716 [Fragaria x ananassa]